MFIATFQTVDNKNKQFTANKHGTLPVIGNVHAGTATGSIIDGTVFQKGGYRENQAYLCKNTQEEYQGKMQTRTEIISEVSALELIQAKATLGAGVLSQPNSATGSNDESSDSEPNA